MGVGPEGAGRARGPGEEGGSAGEGLLLEWCWPHEPSLRPDLIIRTDERSPWAAVEELLVLALRLDQAARAGAL
jgi:hypothetical protein